MKFTTTITILGHLTSLIAAFPLAEPATPAADIVVPNYCPARLPDLKPREPAPKHHKITTSSIIPTTTPAATSAATSAVTTSTTPCITPPSCSPNGLCPDGLDAPSILLASIAAATAVLGVEAASSVGDVSLDARFIGLPASPCTASGTVTCPSVVTPTCGPGRPCPAGGEAGAGVAEERRGVAGEEIGEREVGGDGRGENGVLVERILHNGSDGSPVQAPCNRLGMCSKVA